MVTSDVEDGRENKPDDHRNFEDAEADPSDHLPAPPPNSGCCAEPGRPVIERPSELLSP
jgi:hypothetical protein